LLHNELIPELPFGLLAKMAYQTAKGMHFLHSSGIVHRDLKSLNLLLDSKWAVKVSDFGLTKFKEMKHAAANSAAMLQGSVRWTAPEILDEAAASTTSRPMSIRSASSCGNCSPTSSPTTA